MLLLQGLLLLSPVAVAHFAPANFQAGAFDEDFQGIQFGRLEGAPMVKHMMPEYGLNTSGAVCIDGTDAGFYFAAATDPENANDWQIYFEGGGWCYDEEDCWGRSNGALGSSKSWPNTVSAGGIMDSDCTANPDFCGFNRVYLKYCDGNSFSGNRDQPVVVRGLDGKDKPLYFRGRRIIDAVLATLSTQFGLTKAQNVLLTGCSAGGLATYLHTDYVHERVRAMAPGLTRFKAASISGFFLNHKTVEGNPVYPRQMQNIFYLANSTNGVNAKCIAAQAVDSDHWKCNFAEEAYAYTETDTFPLNSALDSWQTGCIYTSVLDPTFPYQEDTSNGHCGAAAGWAECATNPENCDTAQMATMNQYITDFDQILQSKATYSKAGNGAFIHSCHTHCEAQSGSWNTFSIGGKTMQQAASAWWNSVADAASNHSYVPCQYHTDSDSQHKCNPTC